jgi:hypothetical protein
MSLQGEGATTTTAFIGRRWMQSKSDAGVRVWIV